MAWCLICSCKNVPLYKTLFSLVWSNKTHIKLDETHIKLDEVKLTKKEKESIARTVWEKTVGIVSVRLVTLVDFLLD